MPTAPASSAAAPTTSSASGLPDTLAELSVQGVVLPPSGSTIPAFDDKRSVIGVYMVSDVRMACVSLRVGCVRLTVRGSCWAMFVCLSVLAQDPVTKTAVLKFHSVDAAAPPAALGAMVATALAQETKRQQGADDEAATRVLRVGDKDCERLQLLKQHALKLLKRE